MPMMTISLISIAYTCDDCKKTFIGKRKLKIKKMLIESIHQAMTTLQGVHYNVTIVDNVITNYDEKTS